jgi:hypothetical protein
VCSLEARGKFDGCAQGSSDEEEVGEGEPEMSVVDAEGAFTEITRVLSYDLDEDEDGF